MNVILRIPVDIPEKTLDEIAKKAVENLVNDERDIVQVVRCKDCIYWGKCDACVFFGNKIFEDDFCSRGVRRENQ